MVEDGLNPELLLAGKYGHQLHVWDLRRRRHQQAIDLGAEQQMVLELRPAHDPTKTYGFVGVVVSTADLTASVWLWERHANGSVAAKKVIEIPRRARRARAAAARAAAVRRRAAAHHRHRPERRRQRAATSRAGAPASSSATTSATRTTPSETGSVRLGGIVRRAPHPAARRAQRRPADGRGQPRRQARLPDQLALRVAGTPSSTPRGSTAGW